MTTQLVSDYSYFLPEGSIAQFPADPRDHSKLLVVGNNAYEDRFFYDLPKILSSDDVLFFNNTGVVNARIYLSDVRVVFGSKASNLASGEIFFLRSLDEYHFEAMISPAKHFRVGTIVFVSKHVFCSVESITFGGRIFASSCPVNELLATFGSIPLPPYIVYDESKILSYQTVFATNPGSVAAPTASLHFTASLLHSLSHIGIGIHYLTLHVGISTFKPLVHDIVTDNIMHAEYVELSLSLFIDVAMGYGSSKRIISVGTTVCRVLESLPFVWILFSEEIKGSFAEEVVRFRDRLSLDISFSENPVDRLVFLGSNVLSFYTRLFIYPGFSFRIVGGLLTNFHLPQSSLLLLVAAFLGEKNYLFSLYEHAINSGYKFYSFGDAMLIT